MNRASRPAGTTTVTIDDRLWTAEQPEPEEAGAGVAYRYDTTHSGHSWRLLGWSDPEQPPSPTVIVALPDVPMRWALSRYGLDGEQYHKPGGPCPAIDAMRWAAGLLEQRSRLAGRRANARGEFCALGTDPRHDASSCPGFHS
jgi:hypothetical protein